jgi:hypothetical protein
MLCSLIYCENWYTRSSVKWDRAEHRQPLVYWKSRRGLLWTQTGFGWNFERDSYKFEFQKKTWKNRYLVNNSCSRASKWWCPSDAVPWPSAWFMKALTVVKKFYRISMSIRA